MEKDPKSKILYIYMKHKVYNKNVPKLNSKNGVLIIATLNDNCFTGTSNVYESNTLSKIVGKHSLITPLYLKFTLNPASNNITKQFQIHS